MQPKTLQNRLYPRLLHVALLAGTLVMTLIAQASPVYRWVDDKGQVHFSEKKPPDAEYDQLNVKNAPSSDADRARAKLKAKREARPTTSESTSSGAKEPSESQDELEASLKEDCAQLKRNLEILRSGIQVRTKTEDGEYGDYLDDAQRQASIKENEAYVNVFCN